jgi:hypothetical protein
MFNRFTAATALCLLALPAAQAQVVIYDNSTNFNGFAYSNGGATTAAGNTLTRLVADSIQTTSVGAPFSIDGFSFSVANQNAAAVTARPRVRFYLTDGTGGAPGTLVGGFTFNPISFTASGVTVYSTTIAPLNFATATGAFWAGITFDDAVATTGATAAQLNLLGQGIYGPPTVGSSADSFFTTTAAGSFLGSNPAGTVTNFGGAPVANFGWKFTSPSPVPESGTLWMLLAGLPMLGLAMRRRAHSAATVNS